MNKLQREKAVVYSDNRLRLDAPMTVGELAMLLAPKEEALSRRRAMIRKSGKRAGPYAGAMDWCVGQGLIPKSAKPGDAVSSLPGELFAPVKDYSRRSVYGTYKNI